MSNEKILKQIRDLKEQILNMSADQFADIFHSKVVENEKAQQYRFLETTIVDDK